MKFSIYAMSKLLICGVILFVSYVDAEMSGTSVVRLGPDLEQQAKLKKTESGAQVLYSLVNKKFDERGYNESRTYYSIRINDEEAARDYGRISQSYNHHYYEAELEFANVYSQDGIKLAVDESAVEVGRFIGGPVLIEDVVWVRALDLSILDDL